MPVVVQRVRTPDCGSGNDGSSPSIGINIMVDVAQLVRVLDCGSRGCGFEARRLPIYKLSGRGETGIRNSFRGYREQSLVSSSLTDRTIIK